MKSREYLCTLRPLGEYFLGGERTFRFGDTTGQDGKVDYYIKSEDLPSQTTILGILRFLVLQKAGQLSDSYRDTSKAEQQRKLIGSNGFLYENRASQADYGSIEELGPLFLLGKGNNRLIQTPLNKTHRQNEVYKPFQSMYRCRTDLGPDSLLPDTEDYAAKEGLPDSFLDIDSKDGKLVPRNEIFTETEHTRIKKSSKEEGFFKKVYKSLRDEYTFAFYCRTQEGVLPESTVVYAGQDKSAFAFTSRPVEGSEGKEGFLNNICNLPKGSEEASVFYAASDILADLDSALKKTLLYCVLQTRPFRNMKAGGKASCYRDSMKKSPLYKMIRKGSVFYVRQDCRDDFVRLLTLPGAQQIGLNTIVEMGGNK